MRGHWKPRNRDNRPREAMAVAKQRTIVSVWLAVFCRNNVGSIKKRTPHVNSMAPWARTTERDIFRRIFFTFSSAA
jgi:hypothetical protein